MRRLAILVLAILLATIVTGQVWTGVVASATPSQESAGSAPTAAEINAALTPPGGIKATQTGGNTVGDVIREAAPRADGYRHIDTPATIRALKRLGVNTYVYLVWNSPTDWPDLVHEFAPAAERAGIDLWLYLVPPSECLDNPKPHLSGRCSRPFKDDYVKWAEEISKLSIEHPNVKAWALDDFFSQLPPEEIEEMQRVQDEINPNLGFYTTVYYNDAINGEFYDRYEGVIDGIIYPYTGANSNTQDASHVAPNLEQILAQTEPRGLGVILLAYTGRYLSAIEPPTDQYIAEVIAETRPFMESGRVMGITLYGLPIAGDPPITALNLARSGAGWLSLTPSIFGRTEPGDYAQAEQGIVVNPRANHYSLEFSDFDVYYDQNSTATTYHSRQVLVDGEVVWDSDDPESGGVWHRHYVDLTDALRGKRTATLTVRLLDKTSLSLWTGVVIDDLDPTGFTLRNRGFESRGGWSVSTNNDVILPAIHHYADYYPSNALDAAAAAFRGEPYTQSSDPGSDAAGTAMYGTGRLRLSVEPFTRTPAGSCATASQVLDVDRRSPRYEIDFFQTSPHTPYPGFAGAHQLTVEIDGEPVWTRDANGIYPFWENGNGLQGPIDVTEFVAGKKRVRLAFRLCGLAHEDTRPNPPIDIGFDNLRTVGLRGENFGFESSRGWRFASDADGLRADIAQPSTRPEAPPISAASEMAVARAGSPASIPVTVTNSSSRPMSGELSAVVPDGWTVEPASTPFGPIAPGASATVTLTVDVPAGAAEGSYWVIATADSGAGSAKVAERVQVIGDTIEFTPGTPAEGPWLVEPDGSQLDGEIFDGRGRFADGTTSFTYRFDIPSDATGGTLTLHIGNEFLVHVSSDGTNWTEVLREDREIHDLSNLADRTLDLADIRAGDAPLYVRVEDSKTDDGWGGWLGHLTLQMQTS